MNSTFYYEFTVEFFEADSFTSAYPESGNIWILLSKSFKNIDWLVDWVVWLIEAVYLPGMKATMLNVYFSEENIFFAFWGFFIVKMVYIYSDLEEKWNDFSTWM